MFDEHSDKPAECNARLFISDSDGDGTATIRCQRPPNHEGLHQEQFERRGHTATITWAIDERERCDHGCGQWTHDHGTPHEGNVIPCLGDAPDHQFSDCAYCNPGAPPLTCAACGKTHYHAKDHKGHCPKEPYTCEKCGESIVGEIDRHVWLLCPRLRV